MCCNTTLDKCSCCCFRVCFCLGFFHCLLDAEMRVVGRHVGAEVLLAPPVATKLGFSFPEKSATQAELIALTIGGSNCKRRMAMASLPGKAGGRVEDPRKVFLKM